MKEQSLKTLMHVLGVFVVSDIDLEDFFIYRGGRLFWKKSVNKRHAKRGMRAGTLSPDGYRRITLFGKKYLEHRLIFFLHHKYWPGIVDHIDRDTENNKIENLRGVNSYESSCNRENYKGENEGINFHQGKYQLIFRNKYLGRYNSIKEAREVREAYVGSSSRALY